MNFDNPFVNYFAVDLGHDAGVLAIEVFDGDKLVDVEIDSQRGALSDCQQKAIRENKAAVEHGDHISNYRASQSKAA